MTTSRVLQAVIAGSALVMCVVTMMSIPSEVQRQSTFLRAPNCNTTDSAPCVITEEAIVTSRSSPKEKDGTRLCSVTVTDSRNETYEVIVRREACPAMGSATIARLAGDSSPRAFKLGKEIYSMNVAEFSLTVRTMLVWVLFALSLLAIKLRLPSSPSGGMLALQPMTFMCHTLLLGGLGFVVARKPEYLSVIGVYLLAIAAIECVLRAIAGKKTA